MVNASPWARATILPISVLAVIGYALSAMNSLGAVHTGLGFFSLPTSPDGHEEYTAYCSACHGPDGRGKGRSSRYCSVPPTDLTQLAQKNKGIYPADWVCDVLRRGTGRLSKRHGYMPVWKPLLKSMNADVEGVTELRIRNLSAYIRTLQVAPPNEAVTVRQTHSRRTDTPTPAVAPVSPGQPR
jgi:mono/diheme cytochrome c family protein